MGAHQPASNHPWRNLPNPPPPQEIERQCRECHTVKPMVEFPHRYGRPNGNTCKECFAAASRERHRRARKADPERARQRQRDEWHGGGGERRKRRRKEAQGEPTIPRRWWSMTRTEVETGLGPNWLATLARRGILSARKGCNPITGGRTWYFNPDSVARYMEERG